MKVASLILGILAFIVMMVGFFPCLGSLNWINIPFAAIGLIVGIITLTQTKNDEPKGSAIAGIVLCSVAILLGLIRLVAGGGVL